MSGCRNNNLISGREFVKGILIILVVIDHNEYLRKLGSLFFDPLYIHVAGFFVIAHMSIVNGAERFFPFARKRFVRYGVPFVVFYICYSFVYVLTGKAGSFDVDWFFNNWLPGLFIGSFAAVDKGCGGAFMWFLPALIGFSLLVKISALNRLLFLLASCGSLVIYLLPHVTLISWVSNIPYGIGLGLYLFLVFEFSKLMINIFPVSTKKYRIVISLAMLLVAILSHLILNQMLGVVELGALMVPGFGYPLAWGVMMIGLVAVYISIYQLAIIDFPTNRVTRVVGYIGEASLLVYLTHQVFLHGFYKVIGFGFSDKLIFIAGFSSVFFAVFFSVFSYCILNKSTRLKALIFPRGGD